MSGKKNLAGNPYERLANGIVLQAVEDYRSALRKLKRKADNREAMDEALRIEKFFQSQWYGQLTGIDGEYLIRRLREEIRQSE